MNPIAWFLQPFRQYADFSGRACRSEFWFFTLGVAIISIILELLASQVALFGLLLLVFNLAILIPSLAVTVRRLHDIDRSGWYLLLGLIPLVGAIILLVFYCLPGTPGENRFGA